MINETEIRIIVTGDFCPVYRVEDLALQGDFEAILNDYSDIISSNDLIITDLECPLTSSESRRRKTGPHQKADPNCIKILKYAGVNLAAMANNHIMDYGSKGVSDTISLCKDYGIDVVGIGTSSDEAARPFVFQKCNKKIAILNYADDEFITSPDGIWLCNPLDAINAYNQIKNAKVANDYAIVILHAGNEFYELPSLRTKKLYRYMIDIGADCVIAHHSHVFSGFEIYNSKPIFYGLGNFLYDWPEMRNTGWNNGYVVRLTISDHLDFEIIPHKQCNERPGIFQLNEIEKIRFESKLNYLNTLISDDIKLEEAFNTYLKSVTPMYDAFIEPYFGNLISSLRKRGFFPKLLSQRKRLLLLNIIRCETHREVILAMLKKSVEEKNYFNENS